MPRVPEAQRFVQTNAPSVTPFQPADFSEGGREIAQAGFRLGRTMGEVAENVEYIEDITNEAEAKRAAAAYSEKTRPLIEAYNATRGTQAMDMRPGLEKELQTLYRDTLEGLKPMARGMLKPALDVDHQTQLTGIGRHHVEQVRAVEAEANLAQRTAMRQDAIASYRDPARMEMKIKAERDLVEQEMRRQGSPTAAIDAKMNEATNGALKAVAERIGMDDPAGMESFLKANESRMDPVTVMDLRQANEAALLDITADELLPSVIGTVTPGAALPAEGEAPLKGAVTSGYGMRKHPIDGVMKFHAGVDIAAPEGSPVNASGDGKVIFAGKKGGYGNTVIVRHPDGRDTLYAHLSTINVSNGTAVGPATVIGAVGSTGKATGPHLHYGEYRDGQHVKPTLGNEPKRHDLGRVLERIKGMGLPPKQEKALRAAAMRHISTNEELLTRQRADAREEVQNVILARQGKFTSVSQLGPAYHRLDPDYKIALMNNAEGQRGGGSFYAKQSDPTLVATLETELHNDPKRFMERPPVQQLHDGTGQAEGERWKADRRHHGARPDAEHRQGPAGRGWRQAGRQEPPARAHRPVSGSAGGGAVAMAGREPRQEAD
jgi:murein DD-endopeptidase MepM/ murein hydrolase activator NlpD